MQSLDLARQFDSLLRLSTICRRATLAAFSPLAALACLAAGTKPALDSMDFNSPVPGTTTEITLWKAYDLTASGRQFGVHQAKDEGRFAYVILEGDFDVWCRVEMVSNDAGNLATAGLMARKSLADDAPFVHVAANAHTPKFIGTQFGYDNYIFCVRGVPGGNLHQPGTFMYACARNVNRKEDRIIPFPNCWLRLKRTGNEFRAWFAETSGVPTEADWVAHEFRNAEGAWQEQKPPVIRDKDGVFPKRLYVGLAVDANAEESEKLETVARARFRDIHGLAPAAAGSAAAPVKPAASVEAGRVAEVSFIATKPHADPFNTVTLDVTFTDPEGRAVRVPAFWAGGDIWRARYSSRLPGRHTFRSECSDTADTGLHGVTGEVEILAYTGDNPLYRHGPIRVADDRRHFAHADGTPFFWLGDTWWMGLTKRLRWLDEFAELARDRREKGFNVVQFTAGLYGDLDRNFDERAEGDGGFPWTQDFAHIRPEYFDAADARVFYLVEQGIVPCVVGAWGYWLPWLGEEKMKQHWRYLIARWAALPVVWCAAGETTMTWYLSTNKAPEEKALHRGWTQVIRYIRETDPFKRPVTTHPPNYRHSQQEVEDPALLDFNLQQSGHGTPPPGQAAIALDGWNRLPTMPALSGEARYEKLTLKPEWVPDGADLPVVCGLKELGTREARQAFWAHVLNSGCAGHTYGASGIFQVNRPEWKFGQAFSGVDWGQLPWRDAMHLPGSRQIGLGTALLRSLPWHQMTPATNGFAGATAAAITPDAKHALAFTHSGKAITVTLNRFPGAVNARWFDPTTGDTRPASAAPLNPRGEDTYTPPGQNAAGDADWVLVMDTQVK